jgi:RNA polymerase sigma-70 factor (ECF subfamily)
MTTLSIPLELPAFESVAYTFSDLFYLFAAGAREAEDSGKATDLADWEDIQATLDGDDDAYARLIGRYQGAIAGLMWRFSRQPDVHEELVQRVFVTAYFSLNTFRGDGHFFSWLRTIGIRVGYKWWEERDKKPSSQHQSLETVVEELSDDERQTGITPEKASDLLHRLLERLAGPDRLALTLYYLEGNNMREIGRSMGCSEDAAKMRVYRAREKLRDIVEKENIMEEIQWML